ncbi:DMT family transporter [Brevibacterium album]|uniref:DMT family transporter n=1 Tax=Brevibacterium album TaxID=417948 RepID=UPI00042A92CC|nr:SMR family transporter [Brevibacterium album]
MLWLLLIVSGSLEAVWAHALSDILDPVSAVVFLLALTGSVWGLQRAMRTVPMRTVPMGTAYAIWVGVGASVTAIWAALEGESFGPGKILSLVLIVVGVIGLELTSGHGKTAETAQETAGEEERAKGYTEGL